MKKLSDFFIEAYENDESKKELVIEKLKNALKEEFNAWYGYIIVREFLVGFERPDVIKLYDEIAEDELKDHAYWLMERINQLGGTIEEITSSPASWSSAKHQFISPQWTPKAVQENEKDLIIPVITTITDNINNELGAIETYKELVQITEGIDYTTNSKCKEILADEEEHLNKLQEILDDYNERK